MPFRITTFPQNRKFKDICILLKQRVVTDCFSVDSVAAMITPLIIDAFATFIFAVANVSIVINKSGCFRLLGFRC